MSPRSTADEQEWYGGALVTGTRDLAPQERQALVSMRRDAVLELAKVTATAAVFIALFGIAAWWSRSFLWLAPLVSLAWMFAADIRAQVVLLQFLQRTRGDVTNGIVVMCEGAESKLEVLPSSGLIWSRNGSREHGIYLLPRASTAPVPEHARLAVRYVKPYDETVSVHQRPLSDAERDELARYVPELPLLRTALGLLSIAVVAILVPLSSRHPALLFAAAAACVFVAWRIGTRIVSVVRTRLAVRRDLEYRVAVIVQPAGDEPAIEVLPHSHYLWTEGGMPALWRRM